MSQSKTYAAWTPEDIEDLILEAAETLMFCPNVKGPAIFGTAMPEPVRRQIDAYGSNKARARKLPDSAGTALKSIIDPSGAAIDQTEGPERAGNAGRDLINPLL